MKKLFWLIAVLLYTPILICGQVMHVEGGGNYSSASRMPYFLITNNGGIYDNMRSGAYARINVFSNSPAIDSANFRLKYGIDIIDRKDGKNEIELYQGYVGMRYKFLDFWVGKRTEFYGNQDTILSSGGAIWSGNAPPIPKAMLSTPGFVPVIGFSKLKIYTGIAHGWLGYKQSYIRDPYLHQKFFYLRWGDPQKISLTVGIQHYVQWGGVSPKDGQLPDDFKNFVKVFFAYNNEDKLDPLHSGMPENEARNRIGNHLGTKDVGIDFCYRQWKVKMYWQNFIEDITGVGFRNAMDGIWGITIGRPGGWNFNYEFIRTYTYFVTLEDRTLLDNYFNNTVYRSGWTYKGYVIGTPLITSPVLLADSLIGRTLTNNRVIAHHFAANYTTKKLAVTLHYIYSRNYGNSDIILINPKIQQNIALITYFPEILPRLSLKGILAYDKGELLTNKWGINFIVIYRVGKLL